MKFLTYLVAGVVLCGTARAHDKASVERTIMSYHQEIQDGFAKRDVSRIFSHYDARGGQEIEMKIHPQATDLVGNTFFVRYSRTTVCSIR